MNIEETKDKWKRMINENHIELRDVDFETPLKVKQAFPLTKEGEDFIKNPIKNQN